MVLCTNSFQLNQITLYTNIVLKGCSKYISIIRLKFICCWCLISCVSLINLNYVNFGKGHWSFFGFMSTFKVFPINFALYISIIINKICIKISVSPSEPNISLCWSHGTRAAAISALDLCLVATACNKNFNAGARGWTWIRALFKLWCRASCVPRVVHISNL